MLSRIRIAVGLALALTLLTVVTVFAKGGFSFIAVTGADLDEEVRISTPNLTADFFIFADFYRDQTDAPADPGVGYEITRYYVEGSRETAFDKLHYYPETSFVYYDGIVNGSSEYDGKWYIAVPGIRATFESALNEPAQPVSGWDPRSAQAMVPPEQTESQVTGSQADAPYFSGFQPVALIFVVTGLILVLASVLWFRKPRFDQQPKGG